MRLLLDTKTGVRNVLTIHVVIPHKATAAPLLLAGQTPGAVDEASDDSCAQVSIGQQLNKIQAKKSV